ncbi:MAG: hypothetical protein JSR85_03635 [Proteobacteria bacterium]|nr:hypothetical protein [Pseudomonadota bacterium]
MKFYAPILLCFLSTSAIISSPALSMGRDDVRENTPTIRPKIKEDLTTERRKDLEDFLSKQDYPTAFRSLRATIPATCPDIEIVDFLMKSNKHPEWDKLAPEAKAWVASNITGKSEKRMSLEYFLNKQNYPAAFKSLRATLTCSDAEIINFLMKSNKYQEWDILDPEDKAWVCFRITGKPIPTDLDRREDVTKPAGKTEELAVTLKKLNPDMEDHLAAAWADVMKDQDPALMLGDQYSDEDLTYTFQQPGNPVRALFYKHLMPPHELNGYYALGLTPKRVLLQLEAALLGTPGPTRYKEMIAEGFNADLRGNKLPALLRNNKEIVHLQEQVIAKETEVARWVKTFNAFLGRGIGVPGKEALQANDLTEELFINLPEELPEARLTVSEGLYFLHLAKEELAQHRAKLNAVFMNDRLLLDYITAQISPREDIFRGIKEKRKEFIVTVIANIMNFNLNIYQPAKDTPHDLELVHSYVTPGAVKQLNLLYTNGHFDRLETKLHRHVVPPTEFQDPFAQFKGREASEGTVVVIGEALQNIRNNLTNNLNNLRTELHNLTGYAGEKKDAFIEGYQEDERVKGHDVTRAAAEAEYNKRVKVLEDNITAAEIYCKSRIVSSYIFTHLSKSKIKIDPAEIESALDEKLELCGFPKITYPAGLRIHNQRKVRETILEHWEREYMAFEIKPDGLYGTKDEDADPKNFEPILKFEM